MLPFQRAFKKTWLGHIFVRNWLPNQKCTFLAGLPYPPQKTFYDSGPTRGTKPIPKYVFLHADSIFNVFTWLWRRQSQILTPIWTGKQSDDFGRSPFSIRNVAFRKSVQKKLDWDTFLLEIGDLTKSALFWQAYPTPLRRRSMILVPREAQNLSQSMFSCMLIPFSMFLLDSDEGKVKYSPLYGRGSKVTIFVGRHFQSGMLPFQRAFKKTWLGHIFVRNWRPNQKCTFLVGPFYPPQRTFYDSGPTGGTKPIPKYVCSAPTFWSLKFLKLK